MPMKVHESPLPENSRIARYPAMNYRDCFRSRLQSAGNVTPNNVMAAFWTTTPAWLNLLFKIRNILVRPFGLKTGTDEHKEKLEEALKQGGECGLMSVVEKTADETVIALDDKHLKAFFSVYIEGRDVYLSTVVSFHNKLGVAYFTLIRPFHTLIVKSIFKRMLRERGF